MRNSRYILISILAISISLTIFYYFLGNKSENERFIRFNILSKYLHDNITVGSNSSNVESVLEDIGVNYYYNKDNMTFRALVPNSGGTFLTTGLLYSDDIRIYIKINKFMNVEEINIDRVFTGP